MHKFIIIVLSLVVSMLQAQSVDTLRVMTYNLRFGELATLEQFAAYIKSHDPDLVALQECDWKTSRIRAPKQAGKAFVNEIAYHTGLFGLYGKSIEYGGGYYGIGILSKYPIVKSERIFLPNPEPKKEQRVMLLAEIELPNQHTITFVSTHLEVSSAAIRKAQFQFITEKLKTIKTPIILAGDFNASPDEFSQLDGFVQWLNLTDSSITFPGSNPKMKIDYILGYPKEKMKMFATCTDSLSHLSDHYPVYSKIIIQY